MRAGATLLFALTVLAYPILVYFGLRLLQPRLLAVVLLSMLVLRVVAGGTGQAGRALGRAVSLPILLTAGVYGLALVFDEGSFFLFVPVLVSTALLVGFARTLRHPPSIVESFARARKSDLSAEHAAYCRRVTLVWVFFFLFNGLVALGLAVRGDLGTWTLYNGSIAYVLMGLLFAAEYVYRQWRFREYDGAFTDPVFRRLFPPRGGDA